MRVTVGLIAAWLLAAGAAWAQKPPEAKDGGNHPEDKTRSFKEMAAAGDAVWVEGLVPFEAVLRIEHEDPAEDYVLQYIGTAYFMPNTEKDRKKEPNAKLYMEIHEFDENGQKGRLWGKAWHTNDTLIVTEERPPRSRTGKIYRQYDVRRDAPGDWQDVSFFYHSLVAKMEGAYTAKVEKDALAPPLPPQRNELKVIMDSWGCTEEEAKVIWEKEQAEAKFADEKLHFINLYSKRAEEYDRPKEVRMRLHPDWYAVSYLHLIYGNGRQRQVWLESVNTEIADKTAFEAAFTPQIDGYTKVDR